MDASLWVAIVATTLSVIAVGISAWQARAAILQARAAIDQGRAAHRAAAISALMPFYEAFHEERHKSTRTQIRADQGLEGVSEGDVNSLIDMLDFLGALVRNDLVDFDLVRSIFYDSVTTLWPYLSIYISRRRQEAGGTSAVYGRSYEELVEMYREASR